MVRSVPAPGGGTDETAELLALLSEVALAVRRALSGMPGEDRRRPGARPGQYELDLVADEVVVGTLLGAGLPVLSEESGLSQPRGVHGSRPLLAVVDPVDGSTNASLGIPWYATSICVLDGVGPLVGLVVNLASGTTYQAVRDGGAWRDGRPIAPSGSTELSASVVGVSGLPASHPGWAQFRALGAASLDLCAVAAGSLDGYRVAGASTLHVWDYLAAVLVAEEAGAAVGELDGRELVVRDDSARRPVAAASPRLLEQLAAASV